MTRNILEERYSALVKDYVSGIGAARALYAYPPDDDGLRACAAELSGGVTPELIPILQRQNADCGASEESLASIERMKDPDCICIVTGQQIGLLGGAMYVPYKVLRAVHLAAKLSADLERPVVPVYWLGTNDHDFEEINHATVLDSEGLIVRYDFDSEERISDQPVGGILVPASLPPVINAIFDSLRSTDFAPDLRDLLLDCYAPGQSLAAASMKLAARLYAHTDIVFLDPSDPEFKALIRPVLECECGDLAEASTAAFQKAAAAVEASGYGVQVKTEENRLNLFAEIDGARVALFRKDGVLLDREDRPVDISDCVLSTHVLSRNLCQDAVLNTVAYVAGPGEIAYLALLKETYQAHGITMPVIMPRYMGTLIDPRTARALEALGQPAEHFILNARDVAVHAVFSAGAESDMDVVRKRTDALVDDLVNRVRSELEISSGDNALEADLRKLSKLVRKQTGSLLGNVRKREKQKQQVDLDRAALASDMLLPGGGLQERVFNVFQFMNFYGGLAFMTRLSELLSESEEGHNLWRI